MSFLLFATAAAVLAAATGFLAARRSGRQDDEDGPAPKALPEANVPDTNQKDQQLSTLLPISIEEVVAVEADDPSKGSGIGKAYFERWLAGALTMTEDGALVGAVFIAPEGLKSEAVVAFAAPRKDIGWLSPVEVEIVGEPPTALEIGGVVMQRKRRLFVRLERLGKGAPRIGSTALFAEYQATGRAMGIVLRGDSETLAWSGLRYEAGEYERWGRG